MALALPGLTTGCQAGWLAGWPADEIVLNLKIFKIIYRIKYSSFGMFNKGTVLLYTYQYILVDFFM